MAAVEKFKAAQQDADICIYVRSSGTNFFPPFTEDIHTAVLQPAEEDKLRNLNVTEAAHAAECSTVNTSEGFATCCRNWGQKSLLMQLPFVNVNMVKGPF